MSEPFKDGGPAFPGPAYISGRGNCTPVQVGDATEWQVNAEGLSLRDYFAGQILVGATASMSTEQSLQTVAKRAEEAGVGVAHWIAGMCYLFADAMLEAREVKP